MRWDWLVWLEHADPLGLKWGRCSRATGMETAGIDNKGPHLDLRASAFVNKWQIFPPVKNFWIPLQSLRVHTTGSKLFFFTVFKWRFLMSLVICCLFFHTLQGTRLMFWCCWLIMFFYSRILLVFGNTENILVIVILGKESYLCLLFFVLKIVVVVKLRRIWIRLTDYLIFNNNIRRKT